MDHETNRDFCGRPVFSIIKLTVQDGRRCIPKGMNNFILDNRTRVYFGRGCVREYLACLIRDQETVMLAYGSGSIKKNGVYDEILYILKREGKNVVEFGQIGPGPTYEKVEEGIRLAREQKAELILGVGGGSVMDCCKAISLGAVYQGDLWENFWEKSGIVDFTPLPLGVVVTAGESGSECNGVSILTNEEKKARIGREYEKCSPAFALMDPSYCFSEPKEQMASGGFAALFHVMEIYFSEPDEDNVSDDISEALMGSLVRNLRKAWENPQDYQTRSNLLWASAMAKNRMIKLGKRGDFICRQLEEQLELYTGCSHGAAAAVIGPAYYRRLCLERPEKFVRFAAQVWQLPEEDSSREELAAAGIRALSGFIREFGLPSTLRQLGIQKKSQLKAMAEACSPTPGSYRAMSHEELEEILQECF